MFPLRPKRDAAEGAAAAPLAPKGEAAEGEAAEGAAAAGSRGSHRAPQESKRQSCSHQVRQELMLSKMKYRHARVSHALHSPRRKEEEQKRKLAIRQRADEDETNVALRRKLEENQQEQERLRQSQTMRATNKPAAFRVTHADTSDQVRHPQQKTSLCR